MPGFSRQPVTIRKKKIEAVLQDTPASCRLQVCSFVRWEDHLPEAELSGRAFQEGKLTVFGGR